MKNIPEKIYLQIGDECPDDEDFNNLSEVSWCKDKIYENDIEYALQNKVSDEELNKDEIIREAKRLWNIPNKLEAVKLIMKLGYSLKDAKEYCENNFDRKVGDVSEWKDKAELRLKIREKAKTMFDRYAIYKNNPIAWSVWKIAFNIALNPQFNEQKEAEGEIYDSIYMEVVELVEKDNIQNEFYKETAEKLKAKYLIIHK